MKVFLVSAGLLLATFAFVPAVDAQPDPFPPMECIPENPDCNCVQENGLVRCVLERDPCRIGAYSYC